MDLAYDHIAEQTYSGDRAATPTPPKDSTSSTTDSDNAATPKPPSQEPRQNLQTEFQETFKAFSNSPWGAKLGGLWGNVRKQGESYYEEARKEAEAASSEAMKGFTELRESIVSRTRGLSVNERETLEEDKQGQNEDGQGNDKAASDEAALQENETFLARFKTEAAKRLKEVQLAEDAADEALLRFGTNIRNFLAEAVAVAPPEDASSGTEVLFESKDAASGKRVIHTSRFDAQLHIIHTTLSSFTSDPTGSGEEWEEFKGGFDIEEKTDVIATDLEKYPDLRVAMEKVMPENVEYKDFWTRYYFLRHVVQAQEEKRKELLNASANDTEEVGWDEDSDDENTSSTPQTQQEAKKVVAQNTSDSSSTLQQISPAQGLKPEPRRSHDEKSVADSDASYDLVSGATSRAPSSPKDENGKPKVDESDEEDWE